MEASTKLPPEGESRGSGETPDLPRLPDTTIDSPPIAIARHSIATLDQMLSCTSMHDQLIIGTCTVPLDVKR